MYKSSLLMKYIKNIIDFDRTKMSSSDLVNNITFNQEIINTILTDAWYKEKLRTKKNYDRK